MNNIITFQSPVVNLQLGKRMVCGIGKILSVKLTMVRNEVEGGVKMENGKHAPLPKYFLLVTME